MSFYNIFYSTISLKKLVRHVLISSSIGNGRAAVKPPKTKEITISLLLLVAYDVYDVGAMSSYIFGGIFSHRLYKNTGVPFGIRK